MKHLIRTLAALIGGVVVAGGVAYGCIGIHNYMVEEAKIYAAAAKVIEAEALERLMLAKTKREIGYFTWRLNNIDRVIHEAGGARAILEKQKSSK